MNPGLPNSRADFSHDTLLILLDTCFHSFSRSYRKYLLSTCYAPYTVLGPIVATMNKADDALRDRIFQKRETDSKQTHSTGIV